MKIHYELKEAGTPLICEKILRSLPDWFGIEEAIQDYVLQSKTMPMIAAYNETTPIGFISLKIHFECSAEIFVMGVDKEFHRNGIGKSLVLEAEKYLVKINCDYFQVKTLAESRESEEYKKTRLFYKSIGFKELEIFPTLWDEFNPCLMMVKQLKKT